MTEINRHRCLAAWIFGSLAFFVIIYVVLFGPKELPLFRHQALGILCAVLCGLFAYFFTGTISVTGTGSLWLKMSVRAGGGAACFVLVLLWWHSDVNPIKEVRDELRDSRKDLQKVVDLLETELKLDNSSIQLFQSGTTFERMPKPTQKAKELAKQIPANADNYSLALKRIAEERYVDAKQLLNKRIKELDRGSTNRITQTPTNNDGIYPVASKTHDILAQQSPGSLSGQLLAGLSPGSSSSSSSPFYVYLDFMSHSNNFSPSGLIGDCGDIKMDQNCTLLPHSGSSCIKCVYLAAGNGPHTCSYSPPMQMGGYLLAGTSE